MQRQSRKVATRLFWPPSLGSLSTVVVRPIMAHAKHWLKHHWASLLIIAVRLLLCVCDRLGLHFCVFDCAVCRALGHGVCGDRSASSLVYSILSLCRVCVGAKRKSGLAAENKGLHAQLYFLLSMVVVQSQCVFAFGLPGDARRKWPF